MSNLQKLVGISLFGSAALAMGVAQMQQRSDAMASPAQVSRPLVQKAAAEPAGMSGGNTATLYADSRGHFFADVQVQGSPLKVLVDTGASLVAMSTEDAARIGMRASGSDRKAQFNTANGIVTATLVRIPEIRLQGITIYDVEAAIMPPGAMKGTLLGMSFMKKLSSFESRGISMVMRK